MALIVIIVVVPASTPTCVATMSVVAMCVDALYVDCHPVLLFFSVLLRVVLFCHVLFCLERTLRLCFLSFDKLMC